MLQVAGNYPDQRILHVLYHFDRLRRCDEVLRWLIANRFTGKQLLDWMDAEHGSSMLKTASHVIARVNKEGIRPIVAQRDYLLAVPS